MYIANGSSAEVEAIMILANDLGFISEKESEKFMKLNDEFQRMLHVMIGKLKE